MRGTLPAPWRLLCCRLLSCAASVGVARLLSEVAIFNRVLRVGLGRSVKIYFNVSHPALNRGTRAAPCCPSPPPAGDTRPDLQRQAQRRPRRPPQPHPLPLRLDLHRRRRQHPGAALCGRQAVEAEGCMLGAAGCTHRAIDNCPAKKPSVELLCGLSCAHCSDLGLFRTPAPAGVRPLLCQPRCRRHRPHQQPAGNPPGRPARQQRHLPHRPDRRQVWRHPEPERQRRGGHPGARRGGPHLQGRVSAASARPVLAKCILIEVCSGLDLAGLAMHRLCSCCNGSKERRSAGLGLLLKGRAVVPARCRRTCPGSAGCASKFHTPTEPLRLAAVLDDPSLLPRTTFAWASSDVPLAAAARSTQEQASPRGWRGHAGAACHAGLLHTIRAAREH